MARKSKGRQKVEMVKMQNESNLQVTFSKRRSGLFKKASELSTLCGIEIALIVFSPAKKVFSFGHPSLPSVIDKYQQQQQRNPNPSPTIPPPDLEGENPNVERLYKELVRVEDRLEGERKRGEIIDQKIREGVENDEKRKYWWEAPIGELNFQQLEQLMKGMESLKTNVERELCKQRLIEAANGLRNGLGIGTSIFGRNVGPAASNVRSGSATGTGSFVTNIPIQSKSRLVRKFL